MWFGIGLAISQADGFVAPPMRGRQRSWSCAHCLGSNVTDHTVADYQKAERLTEFLYRGDLAAKSDALQAKSWLELARTQAEFPNPV